MPSDLHSLINSPFELEISSTLFVPFQHYFFHELVFLHQKIQLRQVAHPIQLIPFSTSETSIGRPLANTRMSFLHQQKFSFQYLMDIEILSLNHKLSSLKLKKIF